MNEYLILNAGDTDETYDIVKADSIAITPDNKVVLFMQGGEIIGVSGMFGGMTIINLANTNVEKE